MQVVKSRPLERGVVGCFDQQSYYRTMTDGLLKVALSRTPEDNGEDGHKD